MSWEADLSQAELPDEDPPLAHILIVTLWGIWLIHAQTSDHKNWEIINVCCSI